MTIAPRNTGHVDLTEPEVEGTVLGSILSYPDALTAIGSTIDPEWFADPAARLFAEAALKLHREGHRVSPAALIAAVSPAVERDGLTRAQFVAHVARLALPLAMLSGPLAVLKDRWARRILAREAQQLAADATAIDVDPSTAVASAVAALDEVTGAKSERAAGSLADCTDALLDRIATGSGGGPTTGLRSLDAKVIGYLPEQLYIVAGRPGMGKSAFACSSLRQTAEAGFGVGLFSLEMSGDEVAARCIADALAATAGPTFGAMLRGLWSDDQGEGIMQARDSQRLLPLHVDASARLSMAEIAARARSLKARFAARGIPLGVIAIDHLGLVEPSDRYAGNKVAETGQVSRAGKVLAKELGCCVILLSQLSREVEKRDDKRPMLSDLRWSGDVEQDADVVMFLFRPEYYIATDPAADPGHVLAARNKLEVLIRKNRNGPPDDVSLWCSISQSAIRDREKSRG